MDGSLLLAASAPTHNLSIFDPVSPAGEAIRGLSIFIFAITGFIFIVVEAILIYSIIRFRRLKQAATTDTTEPPQVYGSMPIEVAWTAAPALVVFVLLLVTTRTLWQVNVEPPAPQEGDNAVFVTVTGRQWWWEYRYDHHDGAEVGVITANELHIPATTDGKKRLTYLTLQSADVCHSYWVPRLGGKMDLIPGRINHLWFQTDKEGLYVGQCAEFCGTQHANMLLRVYVDSPDDFKSWLDNEKKDAVEDATVTEGKKIFLAQSCVNCHRVRGTSAKGTYGPDLTHLMSRKTLASGMTPNDEMHLLAWVDDPQKVKPGCLMPGFGLSKRELDLTVRYLLTLK